MICIHNKYFVIYRGDDTDFPGNQELVIELKTDRDLSGCKAHFSFQGYKIDFDKIPEDKRLSIVFPSKETKNFSIGHSFASLRITHGEGDNLKVLTLSNSIDILVTNNVHEAYDNYSPKAITVAISGGGCHSLTDEDIFDMECNDWNSRNVVAILWKNLGGKVLNND